MFEEFLQLSMVAIYTTFAAVTLEVTKKPKIVRYFWLGFLYLSVVAFILHFIRAMFLGANYMTTLEYASSRFTLISVATFGLLLAWRYRKTTFQRIIIFGSFVYDLSGLLSALSFTFHFNYFGLDGVEPYILGCLIDIIIFSTALGYRIKKNEEHKKILLQNELDNHLALEKMRLNISTNLHDDIGATLSSISIYSEAIKNNLNKNNHSKVNELVNQIGVNARETMSNMSDIVWAINPINDNGTKLFERMESFASSILNTKDMELIFSIDDKLSSANFSMRVRQNLFYIFKEALNNCVKYSNATKVEVNITITDGNLQLQILDNGRGFDIINSKSGNGLRNMKQRTAEMKGVFEMISNNNGTNINLLLPFNFLLAT